MIDRKQERLPYEDKAELERYFNPFMPVTLSSGNLPHWRQESVTYFVTFRLADSLPSEKLAQWQKERIEWLEAHGIYSVYVEAASRRFHPQSSGETPFPQNGALTAEQQTEYQELFSARIEMWLDQGSGSCILNLPECRVIVENALRYFDDNRYALGEFVVASNHIHVILAPKEGYELSDIIHSWKSFTAKEILKVDAVSGGLIVNKSGGMPLLRRTVWQKEYFDHIIRNADALERIEKYMQSH